MQDGLRATGLSKNTVRLARASLSALLTDAGEREIILGNPAIGARTMGGRKAVANGGKGPIKPVDATQLAAFIAICDDVFLFMADTGVRPGEAYALRWSDVDLDAPGLVSNQRLPD